MKKAAGDFNTIIVLVLAITLIIMVYIIIIKGGLGFVK